MRPAFEIKPNESCPCGSGKKWKKCHDRSSAQARPQAPTLFQIDQRVDPVLYGFGMNVLECLNDVLAAIKLDEHERDHRMQQACLTFYGLKMYRVTLAGLTLIHFGQSHEAFTIKREQYFYWLALHYYEKNLGEAITFVAYQPVLQRKKAEELAAVDPKARRDPLRQRQLQQLRSQAQQAFEEFPSLMRPKGKSGNTSQPIMIPWDEPRPIDMITALAKDWVKEEAAKNGESLTEQEFKSRVKDRAGHTDFLHSDFPSQDKHGTAFALGQLFQLNHDFTVKPAETAVENPNHLLYIYTPYPIGVIGTLIKFNALDGFDDRYEHIVEAFHKHKQRYGE